LRELGWERRAIDTIMRNTPTIVLDGYRRPVVLVRDYLAYVESSTYTGDRVR
jgi:hypothetical protein